MSRGSKICVKIMRHLISQGFMDRVSEREVERAIVYVRGADRRTIQNWKRALETLGYLERTSTSTVYRMNLVKCPELLVNVLHEQKQKKLM